MLLELTLGANVAARYGGAFFAMKRGAAGDLAHNSSLENRVTSQTNAARVGMDFDVGNRILKSTVPGDDV
jgi:hypothetical protein